MKLIIEPEVIACVKNGICGELTNEKDSVEYWKAGKSTGKMGGWMAVFNRSAKAVTIDILRDVL